MEDAQNRVPCATHDDAADGVAIAKIARHGCVATPKCPDGVSALRGAFLFLAGAVA